MFDGSLREQSHLSRVDIAGAELQHCSPPPSGKCIQRAWDPNVTMAQEIQLPQKLKHRWDTMGYLGCKRAIATWYQYDTT